MRWVVFMIAMWVSITGGAAIYKHIKVGDKLDDRSVLCIHKDGQGYMWFLTQGGIVRYDGEDLKEYNLGHKKYENELTGARSFLDSTKKLWIINKKGSLYVYDRDKDSFEKKTDFYPQLDLPVKVCFLDNKDVFWIGNGNKLYFYVLSQNRFHKVAEWKDAFITDVIQINKNNYAIGTTKGISFLTVRKDSPKIIGQHREGVSIYVKKLFYHPISHTLAVVAADNELYLYRFDAGKAILYYHSPFNLSVTCMKCFGNEEILVATDGAGVYKMNVKSGQLSSFVKTDSEGGQTVRSDIITDLLVDDQNRIWMADYPYGVTVRDERYSPYKRYSSSSGAHGSLINNHVNAVMEDSEGDLWFATNNGISYYDPHTGKWQSVLYNSKNISDFPCNIFVSMCEVKPGVMWAANYFQGIFVIYKKGLKTECIPAFEPYGKFVRCLYNDKEGNIWVGGSERLTRIQKQSGKEEMYKNIRNVQVILEKDQQNMWIGSSHGLWLLNKQSGKAIQVKLPLNDVAVYALYQDKDSLLYIGTQGAALFIYDFVHKKFMHYAPHNSNLVSYHIYHILPAENGNIFMSTEEGLAWFDSSKKTFCNWTRDRGLEGENFNISSGTKRKNGNLVFGSCEGAVEFDGNVRLPKIRNSEIIFENFRLYGHPVLPGEKNSPLTKGINQTDTLLLNSNQNSFSFVINSVNHDYPTDILYSWILKGHDKEWSKPGKNNTVHYADLLPGKYLLSVRLLSKERREVLQRRNMLIIVRPTFWRSVWGVAFYLLAVLLIGVWAIRYFRRKKEETFMKAQNHYFMEVARDIRNPLNLIMSPLENLCDKPVPENVKKELQWVLYHVKEVTRQMGNLPNFERRSVLSENLNLTEQELTFFIEQVIRVVIPYARQKEVTITCKKNFDYVNVYIDPDKVGLILKDLLVSAVRYAPVGGDIYLEVFYGEREWGIEIPDPGAGSFVKCYSKTFQLFAHKDQHTGIISLLLIKRLLMLQRGKLAVIHTAGSVRKVKVTFPVEDCGGRCSLVYSSLTTLSGESEEKKDVIYIVEKEDNFRAYLENCLSSEYQVIALSNGLEALELIRKKEPDLVLSGIKIDGIGGDKLCARLKTDIRTTHIPVILLTVLASDKDYWAGMHAGADQYIVKPCNIFRLKTTVAGLIANRRALKKKYIKMLFGIEAAKKNDLDTPLTADCEWVAKVKKIVEEHLADTTFTIDILCEKIGMSRSSFYMRWKSLTNEAPKDYILRIKMETAAKLLASRQYTVTEVSDRVGFSDSKYFREVFKKFYGTSPLHYTRTL